MRTDRLAKLSLLLALGMILSYVEFLLPIAPSMPGVKIGLANAPVVLLLYSFGVRYAVCYQLARLLLTALLFGNVYSFVYSLAGAALSMVLMLLLKKTKWLDIPGVSMLGGVFHNIGQLLVAWLIVQNGAVCFYLPVLLLSGAVCGYAVGFLSEILLKRRLL